MALDDLPRLHEWLSEPDTRHWFRNDDLTYDGVVAHYGPRIDGDEPVNCWIVQVGGRELGFLQSYRLADHPEYAEVCVRAGADPAAGGIDYLIATPADRDRGLGSAMIRTFVEEIAFAHEGWPQACSGPEPANVRSWRALEKAGFTFLAEIETEEGPERLMARRSG